MRATANRPEDGVSRPPCSATSSASTHVAFAAARNGTYIIDPVKAEHTDCFTHPMSRLVLVVLSIHLRLPLIDPVMKNK
jgi:hypothetical protein